MAKNEFKKTSKNSHNNNVNKQSTFTVVKNETHTQKKDNNKLSKTNIKKKKKLSKILRNRSPGINK